MPHKLIGENNLICSHAVSLAGSSSWVHLPLYIVWMSWMLPGTNYEKCISWNFHDRFNTEYVIIIYIWYQMLPANSVRYKVPDWSQQITWQTRWAPWKALVLWYCKLKTFRREFKTYTLINILVVNRTNQLWFEYLWEINIWIKHSNP